MNREPPDYPELTEEEIEEQDREDCDELCRHVAIRHLAEMCKTVGGSYSFTTSEIMESLGEALDGANVHAAAEALIDAEVFKQHKTITFEKLGELKQTYDRARREFNSCSSSLQKNEPGALEKSFRTFKEDEKHRAIYDAAKAVYRTQEPAAKALIRTEVAAEEATAKE